MMQFDPSSLKWMSKRIEISVGRRSIFESNALGGNPARLCLANRETPPDQTRFETTDQMKKQRNKQQKQWQVLSWPYGNTDSEDLRRAGAEPRAWARKISPSDRVGCLPIQLGRSRPSGGVHRFFSGRSSRRSAQGSAGGTSPDPLEDNPPAGTLFVGEAVAEAN